MSTDPTAMAHEVLYAEELHDGTPANEADLREERWEFYENLCTSQAPALVRAVLELAATVKRVEALADELEAEGTAGVRVPNRTPHDSGWHDSQIIAAYRIRAALNGDDK